MEAVVVAFTWLLIAALVTAHFMAFLDDDDE
jgi:hypothetical protein